MLFFLATGATQQQRGKNCGFVAFMVQTLEPTLKSLKSPRGHRYRRLEPYRSIGWGSGAASLLCTAWGSGAASLLCMALGCATIVLPQHRVKPGHLSTQRGNSAPPTEPADSPHE